MADSEQKLPTVPAVCPAQVSPLRLTAHAGELTLWACSSHSVRRSEAVQGAPAAVAPALLTWHTGTRPTYGVAWEQPPRGMTLTGRHTRSRAGQRAQDAMVLLLYV